MVDNKICVACNGKGFHWSSRRALNREYEDTQSVIHAGPTCEECGGSGLSIDGYKQETVGEILASGFAVFVTALAVGWFGFKLFQAYLWMY